MLIINGALDNNTLPEMQIEFAQNYKNDTALISKRDAVLSILKEAKELNIIEEFDYLLKKKIIQFRLFLMVIKFHSIRLQKILMLNQKR